MEGQKIGVIDYGTGNLRSVVKAFEHLGSTVCVLQSPEGLEDVDALVFPGQGTFDQCMKALDSTGLASAIKEWISMDKPFLGVCLGFLWALCGASLGFWGPFGGVSEVGRTPVAPMWALLAGPWLAWANHAWASQAYGEKNVMLTSLSWRYCPGGRGRTDGRINSWHKDWTSDLRIWGSWSLGHLSTFGSGLSYEV